MTDEKEFPKSSEEEGEGQHEEGEGHEEAESCPVTVAVHVRPLLQEERGNVADDQTDDLVCLDVHQQKKNNKKKKEKEDDAAKGAASSALLNVSNGKHVFEYDYVYSDPTLHGRCPSKLYSDCVEPLVHGLFSGYSATIFAYGQTGSGKTYTMGDLDKPHPSSSSKGVIPSAVETLYDGLAKQKTETKVKISYVEIYNEEIRDLLVDKDSSVAGENILVGGGNANVNASAKQQQQEIHIRESGDGTVHLIGCSEVDVRDKAHMCALFAKGMKLRSTSKTGMNKQSSRSHAIFTISIETKQERKKINNSSKERTTTETAAPEEEELKKNVKSDEEGSSESEFEILRGKIHLVDLAGSERVKRTLAEGSTFKEGVNINKGLLALGNVISALAGEAPPTQEATAAGLNSDSSHQQGPPGCDAPATTHVPYRDSKLTRILRDALGGNSKTVMIACVSPSALDCDESVNTLRYAQRAKNITNIVSKDMLDAQSNSVEALREALNRSRAENAVLKKQLCLCRSEVSTLKSIIKFGTQTKTAVGLGLPDLSTVVSGGGDQRPPLVEHQQAVVNQQPKSAWVDRKGASAANNNNKNNSSVDRGQEFAAEEELNTLDSRMKKLEADLIEKETAMHQVRKGVNEMHVQLVKTCVSPCSSAGMMADIAPATTLAGEATEEGVESGEGAAATTSASTDSDNEMQVLVQTMEREMGELQAQKLDLLQQLQESIAASSEQEKANSQENNVSSSTRSTRANTKKKNSSASSSAKETRQRQMLTDKVKRLESVLSELKQKHAKLVAMERLKKKSDAICDRLKKDVEEIKRQKCQLVREINQKSKRFVSYQKTTRKEMQSLQKEKSKAEQARSKLEINKEKQLQALKRKTEECNKHKTKLKTLTRKNSGNNKSLDGGKANGKDLGGDVPEFQPNALAPLLRDERSRQVWIEEEIEACTMLEKIRDALKESHANNVECSQCIKSLKNKSRLLERKIEKSKRNSSSSSGNDNPLNSQQQVESWEVELDQTKAQLTTMEESKKELGENMKSLEGDLARLMHQKAASFMLNVNQVNHSDADDAMRENLNSGAGRGEACCVSSGDAQRFAKTLISGKHGMNAKGMSTDLRRWSGLRSLAEARGMLRIVFSKAVNARMEVIKSQSGLTTQSEVEEVEGEENTHNSAVELERQNSSGRGATEDVVATVDSEEAIPAAAAAATNPVAEMAVVKPVADQFKEKKHSYVSKGWIDDILKEQAEHMTMLTQWEKEKKNTTTANDDDDHSRSPLQGFVSTTQTADENTTAKQQLQESTGNGKEKLTKRTSSERLQIHSLRPKLGWAETKQVINDVLEKRRQRAPLKASNK